MRERGSVFSGLTIAVLIVLVIGGITVTALVSTADKVDNKTAVNAQAIATDFVNDACNKGGANQADFNKMVQNITSGLDTYSVEITIGVAGESEGKKTQLATNDRNGNNYTVYYTSQVQDKWKENGGKFPLNPNDTVDVKIYTSSSALDQGKVPDKLVAQATATCTIQGTN